MPANTTELEKRLWGAADELRANSKLKSSEYSVPVLGLIFLRYADHKFAKAKEKLTSQGTGRRAIGKADYQAQGVLYLPESARFSTLLRLPEDADIGKAINEAMKAIEAANEDLKEVLPRTYNRLDKELLVSLLKNFAAVPMDIEGDAFGKIYEYFLGKFAMTDKATAVRTFDNVRKHWPAGIAKLRSELAAAGPMDKPELEKRLTFFEQTDIAVVVSPSQNEIEEFKKKGLDIATHRKRMVKEDLETKFKNPDDPLRVVFVCAMWITGFDVPSCSTIYLDKPMKNHSLMQTIARANRVFRDKQNGLIVDYVGVFSNLKKALAIYGAGQDGGGSGDTPVHDKSELVRQLRQAISTATAFCVERGIDAAKIRDARGFEREKLKEDAVAALVINDETRRQYLNLARAVDSLFKSLLPDAAAYEFGPLCNVFKVVAEKIRSELPVVDISAVMADVEALLNRSIAAGGYVMPPVSNDPSRYIDLSQIDFEALRAQFDKGRKPIEVQKLRAKIAMKLALMVKLNRTRMDFLEEFQKMIDEYNAGSSNVETFFAKLMIFTKKLNEEEKRGIAEQLSEEELVIFDLLTKPNITLTKQETGEVKKVAKSLLEKLKQEKLVLDWRKQQTTRAMVLVTIQDILNELPRAYSKELYEHKCDRVYQHFYEAYLGQGKSMYTGN
jgi:type I restriction enzyme, R subunit